jgi:magnesium-transporting ATPase (P-type)
VKTIMATGDNGLTAISVARECSILSNDLPVFLAELYTDSKGRDKIIWVNVDNSVADESPAVDQRTRKLEKIKEDDRTKV